MYGIGTKSVPSCLLRNPKTAIVIVNRAHWLAECLQFILSDISLRLRWLGLPLSLIWITMYFPLFFYMSSPLNSNTFKLYFSRDPYTILFNLILIGIRSRMIFELCNSRSPIMNIMPILTPLDSSVARELLSSMPSRFFLVRLRLEASKTLNNFLLSLVLHSIEYQQMGLWTSEILKLFPFLTIVNYWVSILVKY